MHWNENVVILMKFSSLAALEVVILTTFSAASDENFIKMKTFPFQCMWHIYAFVNKGIIGSDTGLSLVRREVIIWITAQAYSELEPWEHISESKMCNIL